MEHNETTPSGLLDKQHIIAQAGFNRWLVPPAALAIHLCIGMAYGFSVFWLPLSQSIGITKAVACPADMGLFHVLFATTCDWKVADLGWMYTLFFVLLGSSAAIWGGWLERVGPRKAGFVSTLCWCGGLLISAAGVYLHHLWMLWIGSGVIGGIGLGEMVSRQTRHGNRHGDYGLWRRRHDRLAPRRYLDEFFQNPEIGRRVGNIYCHGRDLFRFDADRVIRIPDTPRGLDTRRLDTPRAQKCHDHPRPCAFEQCA